MKQVLEIIVMFLLFAACSQAGIKRVPSDYSTIQAAIDASTDGDTILVAPGTYIGDGNRDIDFKGKAITVKSEEGPQTCIIDCQGSKDDPHRGFFFHTGEDANSVLQGFTITNGYIRYSGGGGIYCDASSPLIENCIVTKNIALFGGGIACKESDSVIVNCIITANTASLTPSSWWSRWHYDGAGGGIWFSSRNNQNPMLINCIVSGNCASEYGGGICLDRGNSVISNCTVYGNRTGDIGTAGGIAGGSARGDKGVIQNCIIWGNIADGAEQIGHRSVGILGEMILNITYCSVQNGPKAVSDLPVITGHWTSKEPYFINPGSWDPNGTPDNPNDDFWIENGDYHLKSQAGRWDPNSQSWVQDDVTSPCIDSGDPNSPIGHEPFPNGGIINMGAYGGTAEASKSYFDQPVCETIVAGDINGDCRVDIKDFIIMIAHWLEDHTPLQ